MSHLKSLVKSTTSPSETDNIQHQIQAKPQERVDKNYSVQDVLQRKGYTKLNRVGSTLQGSAWKAKLHRVRPQQCTKDVVIKATKRSLHDKSITVINGTEIKVEENIMKEADILFYLTNHAANQRAFAKYEGFFSNQTDYFLIMQDGGTDLFTFIQKSHKFIDQGVLAITEWQRFVKLISKQMVDLLDWMQNTMNTCHLDISLENFVISEVLINIDTPSTTPKMTFCDNVQVKLIDFGLAEVFTSKLANGQIDFNCAKYVGKTQYKAPKVYKKKESFDARLADNWCFGVVLFMMVVGTAPFSLASPNDAAFRYVISGKIHELLTGWNRIRYVTPQILSLLSRVLCKEKYRLTIKEIKHHPYFLS